MRSSVITFESRLARRFAYLASDASRFARSDEESAQVERVARAVSEGYVALRDGYAALRSLRCEQQRCEAA